MSPAARPPSITTRRLLAAAALWALCGGCVVPMPIEAEPIEVNLPPFYITGAVNPPLDQIIEFDPEFDQAIELRTGPIGDPNPDDRIFYRWYFNYRPSRFAGIAATGPTEGQSLAALATGSIDLGLEPCVDLITSPFGELGLHTVQVVIADRPFVPDAEDSPTPNQTVPDGAYKTKLVWTIRYDRSKCPL